MPGAAWSTRTAAREQTAPGLRGTLQDRILARMDRDVAHSFTEAQLLELERVLGAPSSRRLPIDIRLTVPFMRWRIFLTFLAGSEHRSAERLKEERARHALCTITNVCFFVFLVVLFIPTFIGLVHIFAIGH